MRHSTYVSLLFPDRFRLMVRGLSVASLLLLTAFPLRANPHPPGPAGDLSELQVLFVPAESLGSVLKADQFEAVLSRTEFEALLESARKRHALSQGRPREAVLSSAHCELSLENGILRGRTILDLVTFDPATDISLNVAGWNVEQLRLGNEPAFAARQGEGLNSLRVLIPDAGKHQLHLQLSAPLNSVGADQVASLGALGAVAERWELELPPGKYLRLDRKLMERPTPADQPARYEIAAGGRTTVDLAITDRPQSSAADQMMFARSALGLYVQPGAVSWIARTQLQITGKPRDVLVSRIPKTLEIVAVQSTGLETWELSDDAEEPDQTILTLHFRQPVQGDSALEIRGLLSGTLAEGWRVPSLMIDDVTSHTGAVVLYAPPNLRLHTREAQGVRPVQNTARPASDQPALQPQLMYEFWTEQFDLQFENALKEAQVQIAVMNLLDVTATGLELSTTATFRTRQAPLFDARIRLPAEYQVNLAHVNGARVDWQIVSDVAGINEVRIPLRPPLQPGEERTVALVALLTPANWPVAATPQRIALPEVRLPQASMLEGMFGISGAADLELSPIELTGLDPATRQDVNTLNARLRTVNRAIQLGFQYQDSLYSGQLEVQRRPALFSVNTVTFFRVDRNSLATRLESRLTLEGGGLREITARISADAGPALRFELTPVANASQPVRIVEQVAGEVSDGWQDWTIRLDQHARGVYILSTDVRQPRGDAPYQPPQLTFPQAEGQTGVIAVESESDEYMQIVAMDAAGVPLAVVEPVDFPQAIYHPQQRIVAGFRSLLPGWSLKVTPSRFDHDPVPSAIGHRNRMSTVVGSDGTLQHEAQIDFTASGAQGLILHLPPGAQLWSTLIDQEPRPARQGTDGTQISLEGLDPQRQHVLRLLYATPAGDNSPSWSVAAPTLELLTGTGDRQPFDILEQQWELHYPPDVLLIHSNGEFQPQSPLPGSSLSSRLGQLLKLPAPARLIQSGWVLGGAVILLVLLAVVGRRLAVTRRGGLIAVAAVLVAIVVVVVLQPVQQAREASSRRTRNMAESPKQTGPADRYFFQEDVERVDGVAPGLALQYPGDAPAAPPPSTIPMSEGRGAGMGGMGGGFGDEQAVQQGSPSLATFSGGLLSLVFPLEVPRNFQRQAFEYHGTGASTGGVELRVQYEAAPAARMTLLCAALGVLLFGWWLRHSGLSIRFLWVFLTIVLPLALLGIAPVEWKSLVDGVLIGGLLSLASWLIAHCPCCCPVSPRRATTASLLLTLLCLPTAVRGEDKVFPIVEPPAPYVVIPYESLDQISQADRVWVPAAIYRELWQDAHPEEFESTPSSDPYRIAEAAYSARLAEAEGSLALQARWVMVSLREEPQPALLPISGVPLAECRLNGEAAVLSVNDLGRATVLLPGRGVHVVDARLNVPVMAQPLSGEFQLSLLPVASGTLTFEPPAASAPLQVRVNGRLVRARPSAEGKPTQIETPIDRGGSLKIEWEPVQSELAGRLVQVETAMAVVVDNVGLQLNHGLIVRVRQGSIQELQVAIPQGVLLRGLSGADVAGWNIEQAGEQRRLTITFRRPITGETKIRMELYRPLDGEEGAGPVSVVVPNVPIENVEREFGQVAVFAPDSLRLRAVGGSGLQQIDAERFESAVKLDLPAETAVAAFRFGTRPVDLSLEFSRRESELQSTAVHAVDVGRRKVRIASRFELMIGGAAKRLVEFDLPRDFLVTDVIGNGIADWYMVTDGQTQRLVVELQQPLQGEIDIGLQGYLVKKPEDGDVTMITPNPVGAIRQSATLGVWLDDIYESSLADSGNWRSIASDELPESTRGLKETPPRFAFRATAAGTPLRLQLRRTAPELSADAGILVAVSDATIDYGLTLRWTIESAAADQFIFTAPDWLPVLEFTGPSIRQSRSERLGDGRIRWTVSLVDPARRSYVLTAAATIPVPQDLVVRTPQLVFESLSPAGEVTPLTTQRQFVAPVNLSSSQLVPEEGTPQESVAASDLPLQMPPELVQQAMDLLRLQPGSLPSWKIQRGSAMVGTQAVVVANHLTTVLETDGSWRTQAVYAIRNRGQQFLALALPADSQTLSVFVRGKPSRTVASTIGSVPVHLVALPQTSISDLSFEVEILMQGRRAVPLSQQLRLNQDEFAIPAPRVISPQESNEFGIPVAQTFWTVYFPETFDASPVENVASTNLTWHRDDVSLQERQLVERLKQDIAALKGVVGDKIYSFQCRTDAQNNLKTIELLVQQRQEERESLPGPTYAPYADYGELLSEVQQALKETDLQQGLQAGPENEGLNGRGFVLAQNRKLQISNGIGMVLESERKSGEDKAPGTKDFDVRSLGNKLDEVKEARDRSELRKSLARQAPIAAQESSGRANRPDENIKDEFVRRERSDARSPAFLPDSSELGALDDDTQQAAANPPLLTSTRGLSVAMSLPKTGRKLEFSKMGGQPMLTLAMRPLRTWTLGLGLLWGVLCLIGGLWALRQLRRAELEGGVRVIAILVGVAGGLGFLLLDDPLRWWFFAMFCGAGLALANLSILRSRNAGLGPASSTSSDSPG